MAASETEAASQAGGPAVPGEHDTDRVIISKIGVDAPITVRQVGQDGQMPNPDGPDDIAFYQFDPAFWPRYGGGPGSGGNVVLAGHVDWGAQHGVGCKNNTVKPPCEAVLWDLARLKTGDVIELQVAGALFKYQVTGSESYAASFEGWSGVLTGGDQEKLTIITCSGSFNPATREYNSRLVVSGVRVS
jgi:sortase A